MVSFFQKSISCFSRCRSQVGVEQSGGYTTLPSFPVEPGIDINQSHSIDRKPSIEDNPKHPTTHAKPIQIGKKSVVSQNKFSSLSEVWKKFHAVFAVLKKPLINTPDLASIIVDCFLDLEFVLPLENEKDLIELYRFLDRMSVYCDKKPLSFQGEKKIIFYLIQKFIYEKIAYLKPEIKEELKNHFSKQPLIAVVKEILSFLDVSVVDTSSLVTASGIEKQSELKFESNYPRDHYYNHSYNCCSKIFNFLSLCSSAGGAVYSGVSRNIFATVLFSSSGLLSVLTMKEKKTEKQAICLVGSQFFMTIFSLTYAFIYGASNRSYQIPLLALSGSISCICFNVIGFNEVTHDTDTKIRKYNLQDSGFRNTGYDSRVLIFLLEKRESEEKLKDNPPVAILEISRVAARPAAASSRTAAAASSRTAAAASNQLNATGTSITIEEIDPDHKS